MSKFASLALAAGLALSAFGLASTSASALPAAGGQGAVSALADVNVTEARVVCGPRGCFRTGPGYRRGYYGRPRFYGRGYRRGPRGRFGYRGY